MNFQQLRFVLAVADTYSFTAAADLCCVTQPALSNAIAQFEEELGGKLFERTTRSVSLTVFGEEIIGDIRRIVDAKSDLLLNSAGYFARDDRTVRIGMSPLISDTFVETILARITALDAGLKVIVSEMNVGDIGHAVASGEINFGLGPELWEQDGVTSKLIYSEPLLYVSGDPNGPMVEPANFDTLASKQILLVGDDCGLSMAVRRLFKENQIPLNEYEGKALGYGVLEKWTHLGIGITLLPASKVTDVSRAHRLNDTTGTAVSIDFCGCWKSQQEQVPSFATVMNAFQLNNLKAF